MTRGSIRVLTAVVLIAGGASLVALRTPRYAMGEANLRAFASGALAGAPAVVDCTLENGASARCLRLVVKYLPDGKTIGPFCPATIDAVREHGGPALDFAAAATALGVSEAALRAALPPPPGQR